MARPKGDPSELVRRLNAALKQAKPSDVVSAELMAEIVGQTWRNLLLTHIEPDPKFPIQKRGAEGVAWEFRVAKVLRHMIRRAEERIEANSASSRQAARLTGFTVPDEGGTGYDLVELGRLADLTLKAQAAKERQRQFVPVETVRAFIGAYNAKLRDAILGTPSRIDPTGAMDPVQRALVDNEMRNVAVAAEETALKFLREWSAGIQ